MLEREYGVGAIHPRVLPQFRLYFAVDEAPAVSGYVDYVAFASNCERAILVHCVGQNVAHTSTPSTLASTTCSAEWRGSSATRGTSADSLFCCTYCRR